MDSILSWFIKSDFVRAQVLAVVRHLVTLAGTAAMAHGLADQSMVEGALGLATTAASFYLANLDVKGVDKKITLALNTPAPDTSKVLTQASPTGLTEEQEKKETVLLNQLQAIKPGVPK